MIILAADHILPAAHAGWIERGALVLEAGRIVAIGRRADIVAGFPQLLLRDLGSAVILPGFVNAHQHGRGISQILMGYPDDALEPWIAGRRRHAAPDVYAVTRLAAEDMLANGVTATVHANYSYGTGDYEAEVEAAVAAYRDSGMRATVCVGFQDRGFQVYPGRDGEGRSLSVSQAGTPPPYAGSIEATMALMERLRDRHRDAPRITFAYGPAGPQWVSDGAWRALAADAAARGLGLHFHLLESPAQEAACRHLYGPSTLAALSEFGLFEARTSCAHGVRMNAQDRTIAGQNGLVVVACPGSNLRLFNGAPPLGALYDSGCLVGLGTDNCALSDDEDYLRELRLGAVLSRHPGIEAAGPSPHDLLHTATVAGSRAAFMGDGAGRLEAGAAADLVALSLEGVAAGIAVPSADRLDLVLSRARGSDVILTMVAGVTLFEATPGNQDLRDRWRQQAAASVVARGRGAVPEDVAARQAALRRHYRTERADR
ncbi:amidohydrolase [Aureimonas sp. SA4125]|uniref:amidohydrolase family protein n=1 Tax=Aureimonas sp. SA4125 TaxID=2826993 RepID=UPI001CC6FEE5|nr:amidohydrolase family protein [Aureimonas sp. SA4125]BDA85132.1 amidohydrolase [Aureimonas sp. SA4125]